MTLLLLVLVIAGFLAIEARRAAANERLQRAAGGIEPPDDVYPIMRVVYPGVFVSMLVEGWLAGPASSTLLAAGALVFAFGKALKWWAIVTLGRRWTFRVVVVPGTALEQGGPYRFLRHPNYVGVAGELIGVLLMTAAWRSGIAGTLLFVALMLARVRVENRALGAILRRS